MIQKTYMAKEAELKRACYVIDATDKVLGRVATKAATILRGKHKATYTPNADAGDQVVIINADKVRVTGNKRTQKIYERYSGYPSGKRTMTFEQIMAKAPTEALRLAVNRMIPRGPLGNRIKRKLKIYVGDKHPHSAQKPIAVEV